MTRILGWARPFTRALRSFIRGATFPNQAASCILGGHLSVFCNYGRSRWLDKMFTGAFAIKYLRIPCEGKSLFSRRRNPCQVLFSSSVLIVGSLSMRMRGFTVAWEHRAWRAG